MKHATMTADTPPDDSATWVHARVGASGFRVEIQARNHELLADEPALLGGSDLGPTPYEYLLGALSSCMAMTLRMYADRKGWPLEGVSIGLRAARAHEKDCENCATEQVGITRIERKIELSGTLTAEQRERLLQIADRCPVKQTLERGIRVATVS